MFADGCVHNLEILDEKEAREIEKLDGRETIKDLKEQCGIQYLDPSKVRRKQ